MKPDATTAPAITPAVLADLIHRSGLSQAAVAARLGISQRSVEYYLAGKRPIPYLVGWAARHLAS